MTYYLLYSVYVSTIDYILPAGVQSTAGGGDEDRRGQESQTTAGPGSATGDSRLHCLHILSNVHCTGQE